PCTLAGACLVTDVTPPPKAFRSGRRDKQGGAFRLNIHRTSPRFPECLDESSTLLRSRPTQRESREFSPVDRCGPGIPSHRSADGAQGRRTGTTACRTLG